MDTLAQPIMNSFIFYALIHVVKLIIQTFMDGPAVSLRLPVLCILITALRAVMPHRQFQSNCRSIHGCLNYQFNNMDQRIKNEGADDRLGKHVHDQNWADHDEEKEYVW